MKKNLIFALVLMVATCLGGLLYEGTAAAQNSNSSTTMAPRSNAMRGRRRHRRHWRRHGRRHGRRGRMGKNANM
jgi:hypothetical protein